MNRLSSFFALARAAGSRFLPRLKRFLSRDEVRGSALWARDFALIFGAVFMGTAALAQPFYVPSGSMQPTLGIGDLLVVEKYPYGYSRFSLPYGESLFPGTRRLFPGTPKPGDVVVFRLPRDTAQTLVKRVVALPGDRVQMRGGRLWINGKQLPLRAAGTGKVEDGPGEAAPGVYFTAARTIETLPNGREHPIFKKVWNAPYDDTPEYVVPAGCLFVMGDNRDDSADSRIAPEEGGVGFLPIANVTGRVRLVLASVDFVNADYVLEWPFELRLSRTLARVR